MHFENIFRFYPVVFNILIDFKEGRSYCEMEVCPYGYNRMWSLSEWQMHFIQTMLFCYPLIYF